MSSKRSRNVASGEGTSRGAPLSDEQPPPPVPAGRFRGYRNHCRYDMIYRWSIIKERRVELEEGEYPEFWNEIVRRNWQRLATPEPKYNPSDVYEFYANALPDPDADDDAPRRSLVDGRWIPYDRDAINDLLGRPLTLRPGARCHYYSRRVRATGFSDDAIARALCREGLSYEVGRRNTPIHILRRNMTYLAQAWMTFILSNVVPSDHNSDLSLQRPFGKALVAASIMMGMTIDVAQLISDTIHQFVISEPVQSSAQPKKSLGFPSLITSLCRAHGAHPFGTHRIRPSITRIFIERNCYQGYDPQLVPGGAAHHPPPPVHHAHPIHHVHPPSPDQQDFYQEPQIPSAADSAAMFQRLSIDLSHLHAQQAANHRGQLQMYNTFHDFSQHLGSHTPGPFPWPPLDAYSAYIAWPGDSPTYPEGAAAAAEEDQGHDEDEEEED